jgi:type IV pilus assembly protein PilE
MNLNKHAFTLIELLVVVLIIGILAAIALPQYYKSVAKTEAINAVIIGKAIKDAQEIYYMQSGQYASSHELLPISVTLPKGFSSWDFNERGSGKLIIKNPKKGYDLIFSYQFRSDNPNRNIKERYYCSAIATNAKANDICKLFSPTPFWTDSGYNRYYIK